MLNEPMIVYTTHITPRLQYILNFFSGEISNESWRVTTNKKEYLSHADIKINYSEDQITEPEIRILPHGLLFEKGIAEQKIRCTISDGQKIFFQNSSEFGFDVFAAAFYLVSRYEEYLPYERDKYGRYPHQNSLAFKEGFLQQPLVNIWIERFKNFISQKNPSYQLRQKEFTFLPTYDIDMAWSYQYKSPVINAANLAKDFFSFRITDFSRRYRALSGLEQDPFDTFEWLDTLHQQTGIKPKYFFLVAEKRSGKDKNISPHHPCMQQLIRDISQKYPVGIHPSWLSNSDKKILQREKKVLEEITGSQVYSSRQHYLMLSLPLTYQNLIQCGIKKDYSLGYSGENGFRASVASAFNWYDLENDEETTLVIYPFCFMEGTSLFYKKQTPGEALNEMLALYQTVKNLNGFFSMIWHNSSLSNINEYKGWRDIHQSFIGQVCS